MTCQRNNRHLIPSEPSNNEFILPSNTALGQQHPFHLPHNKPNQAPAGVRSSQNYRFLNTPTLLKKRRAKNQENTIEELARVDRQEIDESKAISKA